jgi:hypothetical protein
MFDILATDAPNTSQAIEFTTSGPGSSENTAWIRAFAYFLENGLKCALNEEANK